MKKALICGISGQDGAYLARMLIEKGYSVYGTSRDSEMADFQNLHRLGVNRLVSLISMAPTDFRSVLTALTRSEPDEVYFLAGQSSVGLSFDQPVETLESITLGALNLLEAVRFLGKKIKIYHASSSECFGNLGQNAANEDMPFRPRSPYAVAKASAHWMIVNYRESYNLFACNGILFNHESPLRPARFVTRKIIDAANRIADGSQQKLTLGRLDIVRDWGWAPEYVDAMWRMLQQDEADDYIIATEQSNSLADFVACAFELVNLDWRRHVITDPSLFRPADLLWSQGNASKAHNILGWRASYKMQDVIRGMMASEDSV